MGKRVHLAKNGGSRMPACGVPVKPAQTLLIADWQSFNAGHTCMRPRCTRCVAYAEKIKAANEAEARADASYWDDIRAAGFAAQNKGNESSRKDCE
jgi:hypothetical protein